MKKPGFLKPIKQDHIASAIQRHLVKGQGVPVWQDIVVQRAAEEAESGFFKYQVSLPTYYVAVHHMHVDRSVSDRADQNMLSFILYTGFTDATKVFWSTRAASAPKESAAAAG
jgi:hypothetical protein